MNIAKSIAAAAGYAFLRADKFEQYRRIEAETDELFNLFANSLGVAGGGNESKAQLKQDLFVFLESGQKRNGFFVEFGATNGIDLSNTYLLEKHFGWSGILAEPATCWHAALRSNRKASIETECVWSHTGKTLEFNMADEAEYSTIGEFNNRDFNASRRVKGQTFKVNTVSLLDLLKRHNAPRHIDYLSIDTEGSELEILSSFDFTAYDISIITCEHNFTEDRKKIFDLLSSKGYKRKFERLSKWDDWYVKQTP